MERIPILDGIHAVLEETPPSTFDIYRGIIPQEGRNDSNLDDCQKEHWHRCDVRTSLSIVWQGCNMFVMSMSSKEKLKGRLAKDIITAGILPASFVFR